ncbi:MAG: hypothetical protein A3I66_00900 [Burkholderiales bacterium RIFCSPLOWO2_02_FULL_57_36]|nr:MAG: hypothetical protein A3I66_00900 [Burkholderiales bacterium RIFCSPLOWO2_02_FULL_57_36]
MTLVVAILLHTTLLLTAVARPEIGKNAPLLVYPVRERVPGIHLAERNTIPSAGRSISIMPHMAMISRPVSVTEGKLERDEKRYIEHSARYFMLDELDDRPAITSSPDLGVADLSPTIEGAAVLLFYINEVGSVDRIEVEQSTLPEVMVEDLQLKHYELLFTPGKKNGVNVKSVVRYEIVLARDPSIISVHSSDDFSE